MNYLRFARRLALGAGLLDFGTGLGLAFLPAKVLPLMRVPTPSDEALVYLRFVGVFVAAVGASYLLAIPGGRRSRLRSILEFTLIFRLAAGVFATVAIGNGWLALAWAGVPAADFALLGIQLWLIAKLPADDIHSSSISLR
jgi:hypothetical protein